MVECVVCCVVCEIFLLGRYSINNGICRCGGNNKRKIMSWSEAVFSVIFPKITENETSVVDRSQISVNLHTRNNFKKCPDAILSSRPMGVFAAANYGLENRQSSFFLKNHHNTFELDLGIFSFSPHTALLSLLDVEKYCVLYPEFKKSRI